MRSPYRLRLLIAVGVAILVSGNWMLAQMIDYTQSLWASVPSLLS